MGGRAAEVVDAPVVRALREAVASVAACSGSAARSAVERRALLAEVDRASAVLATVRGQLLVAERDSGAWRGAGDASFAAWRGRTTRQGVRAGAVEERRADTLAQMPGLREATAGGQVSLGHVDVVGRTTATGSATVRAMLGSPGGQERVLDLARRLDAGRFASAMAQLAARVDAAGLERTHQAQRAARFVHLADGADGTRITGRLDAMAGHRLRLALEALSPRPDTDDERTPEQRRADALTAMADKLLALPDTVPGAAVRPHISFLMTEDTWTAVRAAHGRADAPGPMDPVTLQDGTPVPANEVARALCDCELTRIVLDAASEPIDLGRTARTYTGAQRRAVLARDGACAWDGCTMAPRWLEIHHADWWDRDTGPTSVQNGAAVCSYHHHEIHRRDLTVTRRPLEPGEVGATSRRVRYLLTDPTGRVIAGRPPGVPDAPGRPPDRRPPDAQASDRRPPDGRPPDGRPPDGRPPDGRPPDQQPPAGPSGVVPAPELLLAV